MADVPGLPERIVLIGFMGSGKTTAGRALADLLGWGFRDLDAWTEERAGLTVAELFRARGEAGFRAAEQEAAGLVSTLRQHVVATGGGAFSEAGTRAALRAGAVTVWLQCDFETSLARVAGDPRRPLASNRATMARLYAEREASYRLADVVVDASKAAPEEVARRVLDAVKRTR